jgi:hypothetical protein
MAYHRIFLEQLSSTMNILSGQLVSRAIFEVTISHILSKNVNELIAASAA